MAINDANEEYDKLLNKYYQILLSRLKDADKPILRQTQRNWIQFRDSEENLNVVLSKEEYTGGGSADKVIYLSDRMELTKRRVIDIHNYFFRFNE